MGERTLAGAALSGVCSERAVAAGAGRARRLALALLLTSLLQAGPAAAQPGGPPSLVVPPGYPPDVILGARRFIDQMPFGPMPGALDPGPGAVRLDPGPSRTPFEYATWTREVTGEPTAPVIRDTHGRITGPGAAAGLTPSSLPSRPVRVGHTWEGITLPSPEVPFPVHTMHQLYKVGRTGRTPWALITSRGRETGRARPDGKRMDVRIETVTLLDLLDGAPTRVVTVIQAGTVEPTGIRRREIRRIAERRDPSDRRPVDPEASKRPPSKRR